MGYGEIFRICSQYRVVLKTDHKPLVPLRSNKSLDLLPPHVLGFIFHLIRFQYTINHVPGKTLYTADVLSKAPLKETSCTSSNHVEQFVQVVTAALPANQDRLDSHRKAQAEDNICSKLIEICTSGWPLRNKLSQDLKDYWRFCGKLTLSGTLLLYQSRIIIPASTRQVTLEKIHCGHQGIQRCGMHVFSLVWWPGMVKKMKKFVQSCPVCQRTTPST